MEAVAAAFLWEWASANHALPPREDDAITAETDRDAAIHDSGRAEGHPRDD